MIAQFCSNLTNINISALSIYPKNLDMLTENCKKVTRLSLGGSKCISDKNLKKIFREYQDLDYFAIRCNGNISGECLLYLPVQTMRTLVICYCRRITDVKLSAALARLENLEYLAIYTLTIGKSTMEVINNNCKNLKKLQIFNYLLLMDMLQFINLGNLRVLTLRTDVLSDEVLIRVVLNCSLNPHMDISGCKSVSDAGLTAVATLPKLECLYINYLFYITDHGLKNIVNLKNFECRLCEHITDDGICKVLASSPELQILNLICCHKITNATYEAAKQICDSRRSKIILEMFIQGTQIVLTDEHKVSPFLQIVKM